MSADVFASGPETEAFDDQGTFTRLFHVGSRAHLVLENPRGRIRVEAWDRPEIRVQAQKHRTGIPPERYDLTRIAVHQDGSWVTVRTVADGLFTSRAGTDIGDLFGGLARSLADTLWRVARPCEVTYEVMVPVSTDLELRTVSGPIVVSHVAGSVHVAAVSGNASLHSVRGPIAVRAVSGSILAENLDGPADVRTVSGSIQLEGRLRGVRLDTVSGSSRLAGILDESSSCEIHSVSGSATLALPPEARLSISARGVSFTVAGDLPYQVSQDIRRLGAREWAATLNGGGTPISFRTVSGQLYLTRYAKAEEAASAAPPPAAPSSFSSASASPERVPGGAETPAATPSGAQDSESEELRILRAVERGELSVEDALKRLDDLRTGRQEGEKN
ncbi:MAG: hypothetical protein IRY83_13170 [Chloroflexi bacterium]|nr:hypothetical protein [Chloroflexota bacterium]